MKVTKKASVETFLVELDQVDQQVLEREYWSMALPVDGLPVKTMELLEKFIGHPDD